MNQTVRISIILTFIVILVFNAQANEQNRRRGRSTGPSTLGLDQGMMELDTPDFTLKLVKVSQTVAALEPKGGEGFDFTPVDQLESRSGNGYYHLGDIDLRIRTDDQIQSRIIPCTIISENYRS